MKKQDKKTKKYSYIADLTTAETPGDVRVSFILGKVRAGLPIKEADVKWLVNVGVKMACEVIDAAVEKKQAEIIKIEDDALYNKLENILVNAIAPKKPWYKRFWNWVTKPFRKREHLEEGVKIDISK